MPYYMLQAAYTPEGWAALVQNPEDRREAIRSVVEELPTGDVGAAIAYLRTHRRHERG